MSKSAKTIFLVFWTTIIALSLSCNKGESGAAGSTEQKGAEMKAAGGVPTVAYSSVGDPNPWFTTFAGEMEKEAKKRGYKFTVVHAQAKIEKQLADVEDLVAQKPDVLILGPIDVKGSAACLGVAKEAKVPVIVVNRDIAGTAGKDYVTRLHSDFEWVGA